MPWSRKQEGGEKGGIAVPAEEHLQQVPGDLAELQGDPVNELGDPDPPQRQQRINIQQGESERDGANHLQTKVQRAEQK